MKILFREQFFKMGLSHLFLDLFFPFSWYLVGDYNWLILLWQIMVEKGKKKDAMFFYT